MRPRRQTLASGLVIAPLALLLAACGDSGVGPRVSTLTETQISSDVVATSGDAVAGDVVDLLAGEAAAGLTASAPAPCPYDAASGYHVCTRTTANGFQIVRRFQFRTASDTPMQSYDPTLTASVNFLRTLDGSSSGTTDAGIVWTRAVHQSSDRTVTGLAGPETQRIWNGTDTGADTTTHTGSGSSRTYAATVTQTTRDLVVSVPRTSTDWPLSGTITREISAKLSVNGARDATRTVTRTVVVTFNGSATVPITVNGIACTLDLSTRKVSGCQ